MLRLLGRVGLLAIVACVIYPFDGFAEIVSVDDPRLIAIREHIMKAYYLRPEPVDQCTEKVSLHWCHPFTTIVFS